MLPQDNGPALGPPKGRAKPTERGQCLLEHIPTVDRWIRTLVQNAILGAMDDGEPPAQGYLFWLGEGSQLIPPPLLVRYSSPHSAGRK
jgi:hypothetical protein